MTRTLKNFRPQHDDGCESKRCRHCGDVSLTHIQGAYKARCGFQWAPRDCSCGLDALLLSERGAGETPVVNRLYSGPEPPLAEFSTPPETPESPCSVCGGAGTLDYGGGVLSECDHCGGTGAPLPASKARPTTIPYFPASPVDLLKQALKAAHDRIGNIINDAPYRLEERDAAWQAFLQNRQEIESAMALVVQIAQEQPGDTRAGHEPTTERLSRGGQ